jgi:protein-tyrosine kinase
MDWPRLRALGLLPSEADTHQFGEQYRAIKRGLLRSCMEPVAADAMPRRLIMIASALPGEGKTFTSLNLSLSLALEKDLSVVLVDCDPQRPQLTRALGLSEHPGLLDVLADSSTPVEAALKSVLLTTDVPRLRLLPVGHCSENSSELLTSARMKSLLKALSVLDPKGLVLFDASPLLVTVNARNLSSLVGQVILVVKAGSTPQQALQDTLTILGNEVRVSLILNQAVLTGPMGYYYGYGYGHEAYRES